MDERNFESCGDSCSAVVRLQMCEGLQGTQLQCRPWQILAAVKEYCLMQLWAESQANMLLLVNPMTGVAVQIWDLCPWLVRSCTEGKYSQE